MQGGLPLLNPRVGVRSVIHQGRGVDLTLNPISGETLKSDLKALAPLGTAVLFGFLAGPPASTFGEDLAAHFQKSVAVHVSDIYTYFINRPDAFSAELEKVFQLLGDGVLRPLITSLPLSDASEAHRRLEAGETTGKLVLSIGEVQDCHGDRSQSGMGLDLWLKPWRKCQVVFVRPFFERSDLPFGHNSIRLDTPIRLGLQVPSMKRLLPIGFLVGLFVSVALGQNRDLEESPIDRIPGDIGGQEQVSGIERFRLFNGCRPMKLVIEGLPSNAKSIGLTEAMLQAAVESRLRAARLYTESSLWETYAYLYVNINVVGPAFKISLEYNKVVSDRFDLSGPATTWSSSSTGTHGESAGYIITSLSQHIDRFLAAYLRVNEFACE